MKKKYTEKSKRAKKTDSLGLRIVKNIGGALPLVGLLVGGAALAGGAVAVSKMSNAEDEGLDRDEDFERTLQGITLNNTTTPSTSTTSTNSTSSSPVHSTVTRNGPVTGGLRNDTPAEPAHRRTGGSQVTSRLRSLVPSQLLSVDLSEFERGLSSSSIRNAQSQMVRLFNMDSDQNGAVIGVAQPGERLDDSFSDGIMGPSTRALIYLIKRGAGQSTLDSHLDQIFLAELDRRSRGITNYSWGLGTIKTVSRKRRLR